MFFQISTDILALIVAIVGTISSIMYSEYNKRIMQRQFDLQFASQLELLLPSHRLIVSDARFPIVIKNYGPLTASSIKLRFIYQLNSTSVPINLEPDTNVSPDESIERNIFFELNTVLQEMDIYDSREHKVLNREPVSFSIEYEWKVVGLNSVKRNKKDLTLIWQGGQYERGLEWNVV